MRCIITYRWSKTKFSGGQTDFGVSSTRDPRIKEEIRDLRDRQGMYIVSVKFW